MKVGDLVMSIYNATGEPGIVVDIVEKKVARITGKNKIVNWDKIEPEPHATVLWSYNDGTINIPISELEVVNEDI